MDVQKQLKASAYQKSATTLTLVGHEAIIISMYNDEKRQSRDLCPVASRRGIHMYEHVITNKHRTVELNYSTLMSSCGTKTIVDQRDLNNFISLSVKVLTTCII